MLSRNTVFWETTKFCQPSYIIAFRILPGSSHNLSDSARLLPQATRFCQVPPTSHQILPGCGHNLPFSSESAHNTSEKIVHLIQVPQNVFTIHMQSFQSRGRGGGARGNEFWEIICEHSSRKKTPYLHTFHLSFNFHSGFSLWDSYMLKWGKSTPFPLLQKAWVPA